MAATTRPLVDGTYDKYGLDVTIRAGGPQVNHSQLLAAGKIDFNMGGNLFEQFNFTENNVPMVTVAAIFQKEPQVLIAHPDAGVKELADLDEKTFFISNDGRQTYWLWLQAGLRLRRRSGEALHLQPGAVPGRHQLGAAGLRHLRAVRHQAGGRVRPGGADDGRFRLRHLLDHDRDLAEAGRREPGPGAALRQRDDRGLVQLSLRRQRQGQRA